MFRYSILSNKLRMQQLIVELERPKDILNMAFDTKMTDENLQDNLYKHQNNKTFKPDIALYSIFDPNGRSGSNLVHKTKICNPKSDYNPWNFSECSE